MNPVGREMDHVELAHVTVLGKLVQLRHIGVGPQQSLRAAAVLKNPAMAWISCSVPGSGPGRPGPTMAIPGCRRPAAFPAGPGGGRLVPIPLAAREPGVDRPRWSIARRHRAITALPCVEQDFHGHSLEGRRRQDDNVPDRGKCSPGLEVIMQRAQSLMGQSPASSRQSLRRESGGLLTISLTCVANSWSRSVQALRAHCH